MIKIITRTSKGEVFTFHSDDAFHQQGWITVLSMWEDPFPLLMMKDSLVTLSYEEAGQNHLKLCERIK